MRTTIDRAGRVVVPKSIRERLGIDAGGEVEIVERGGVIEISPVAAAVDVVDRPGGPVAVARQPLPPLTDDDVLETIDRSRR